MRHADEAIPSGAGHRLGGQRIAGLDGLRGVAVALVVVYHLWPTVLPGGFLGVNVFFALSGYLIVGLLVTEHDRHGRIDLRAFVTRRVRRLLPLALAVLTAVALVWTAAGWMTGALRRDLTFSVAQLANWGQLTAGVRYGAETAPSPVVHYWSLAIEEQVYLVLPLVVVVLGARRGRLALALALGAVVSLVATLRWSDGTSAVYFSTVTRMGEIFVGGLVAVALTHRPRWSRSARAERAAAFVALAGLAAVVLASVSWSVSTPIVHRGGLLVIGTVAALVVGGVACAPRVGRALDVRPLVRLGQVSYAVYLVHWPLLVGLAAAGVADRWVPWLTLAGTWALAVASGRWFEGPVRSGRVAWRPMLATMTVGVVAVVGVSAVGMRADHTTDFEAAGDTFAAALSAAGPEAVRPVASRSAASQPAGEPSPGPPSTVVSPVADVPSEPGAGAGAGTVTRRAAGPPITGPAVGEEPKHAVSDRDRSTAVPAAGVADGSDVVDAGATSVPSHPPSWFDPATGAATVVGYFGDSKAMTLALGAVVDPPPGWTLGTSWTRLGCPLGRAGPSRRPDDGRQTLVGVECDWTDFFTDGPPTPDEPFGALDVAVVWFGTWDVIERQVPGRGNGEWLSLEDAEYRAWWLAEADHFLDEVDRIADPKVILLLTEPSESHALHGRAAERWRQLLGVVSARRGDHVRVVDVAAWVDATGAPRTWFPDGLHPSFGEPGGENSARWLHDQLLLPEIRAIRDGAGSISP